MYARKKNTRTTHRFQTNDALSAIVDLALDPMPLLEECEQRYGG
jgi:hypothetical protein